MIWVSVQEYDLWKNRDPRSFHFRVFGPMSEPTPEEIEEAQRYNDQFCKGLLADMTEEEQSKAANLWKSV